ncbi:MAG: hypothetical protein JWP12_1876 [Bacteroidetes bacterium]|nr:hypothetical protein [Bacteroidota bacterium]
MNKLEFLKTDFPALLQNLKPDAKGAWGVMNGQQMVEHMAESISYATGKNNQALHTPPEYVAKAKEFAMSDKEFKPNTKNALMPEIAAPVTKANMEEAIAEVRKEIADFVTYFENNKGATLMNSFFGELNFEEWTHLLHKHSVHHLKQFGLM